MYEEPSESLGKMLEKGHRVLLNNIRYIHPLDLESLLKEIFADYEGYDLDSKYHKQYYPYLRALILGVKRIERKSEVDERRRLRVREAMKRRKMTHS